MIDVSLRIPAALRDLTGGEHTVVVHLTPTGDVAGDRAGDVRAGHVGVRAMLDALADTHPALERRIRDERGHIRTHVNLFIGSDNVRDGDGLDTPLAAGDILSLIPAVSGG